MLNKELIQEVFIETPLHDGQGRICPLPLAGRLQAEVFKKSWMEKRFPDGLAPMVSAGPKVLPNGIEGYSIRREIVYKSPG